MLAGIRKRKDGRGADMILAETDSRTVDKRANEIIYQRLSTC